MPANASVGFAWFTREEWLKLTAVVPNRSELDDTYEAWERSANEAFRMVEANGTKAKKIMVEVAALVTWCQEHGKPVNGALSANKALQSDAPALAV